MHKSKLLQLLQPLKSSPREFREFEKFVHSPFHNSRNDLIQLLQYIKQSWKEEESVQQEKLNKTVVFSFLFPNEEFKVWKIKGCISNLSLLLEEYFMIQAFRNNERFRSILLSEALKTRGIDKHFFKKMAFWEEKLLEGEQSEMGGVDTCYRDLMWLNQQIYFHPNQQNMAKENEQRLVNVLDYLDLDFVLRKLQFACEAYSRKKIFGSQIKLRLLPEIRKIARTEFGDKPLLLIYLDIISLFEDGDLERIPPLKERLFDLVKNGDLRKETKADLVYKFFNALPPYPDRFKLYFELYTFLVDTNLLVEYGYIPPDHFSNIVHLGCVLKKEEWLLNFIKENTRHLRLDEDKMENIQRLFQAQINFNTGNFNEAFSLLFSLKISDATYGLRYHTLLIRTIIDGRRKIKFRFDLEACCRNFKVYVKRKYFRKEISQLKRDGCLIFIKISAELYNWRFKKGDKDGLLALLSAGGEIPYHEWLKERILNL